MQITDCPLRSNLLVNTIMPLAIQIGGAPLRWRLFGFPPMDPIPRHLYIIINRSRVFMLAKVFSSAVLGIDAFLVEVEVDIMSGLPTFATVGLPEAAVKEGKERVKSAIKNSGYTFPDDRITVNLAPANIKKEGTGFDLPIALGILSATRVISQETLSRFLILGELSLDGRIKPVNGSLPMALAAQAATYKGIIVPYENRQEAAVVRGISVYPAKDLPRVVDFLRGDETILPEKPDLGAIFAHRSNGEGNFSEVFGQEHVKRA